MYSCNENLVLLLSLVETIMATASATGTTEGAAASITTDNTVTTAAGVETGNF